MSTSMYYIYKITNTINGKCYIGQHKMPKGRETFKRYMGNGIAIRQAIIKYGKKNFTKYILEYIEDDEKHETVSEREKFWIKECNSLYPNGYNIAIGGEGGITSEIAKRSVATRKSRGYKHSEETKKKISLANKGKTKSKLHKKHLSDNHHLKTLHTIIFEDGHIENTFDSFESIAKRFKISGTNTLLRYSARKQFINGIYLENIDANKYVCTKQYKNEKREKLCFDPIEKDTCTFRALYFRKTKGKTKEFYKEINLEECVIRRNENEV